MIDDDGDDYDAAAAADYARTVGKYPCHERNFNPLSLR